MSWSTSTVPSRSCEAVIQRDWSQHHKPAPINAVQPKPPSPQSSEQLSISCNAFFCCLSQHCSEVAELIHSRESFWTPGPWLEFFFCKYLTLLHQGTPCEAWAGFVSAGGGSLTKTQDPRFPARLSHPKLCSLVAAREVSPWSQRSIKSFLPLLLLIVPCKTTQRAAQEQLDG